MQTDGSYTHEFVLRDHLGNTRVTFKDIGNDGLITDVKTEITQINSYYPFGMNMEGNFNGTGGKNKYQYNGKEWNDDFSLGWNDYGARFYDPALARWWVIDPLAEKMRRHSPYNYAFDNPMRFVDPDGMAPGDPVGPGYYAAYSKTRSTGFFLRHPVIGTAIGEVFHGATNISTNSVRFSLNTGLPENKAGEGSHINGFRHVLWQASITSKFGESVAKQVGNAHEDNPSVSTKERSFKSLASADQTIDLLNNVIGRQIGKDNPNASMKELALKTLDSFKENGVWTATKQSDGTFTIGQTKLTQAQYENASNVLNSTNDNGYTPKQQLERNDEIQKGKDLYFKSLPNQN